VVIVYLIIILLKCPYIRLGHDRFHMCAQVVLFLMLLSALILSIGDSYDGSEDILLSIILIIITILLFILLLFEIMKSFRTLFRRYQRLKLESIQKREVIENDENEGESRRAIESLGHFIPPNTTTPGGSVSGLEMEPGTATDSRESTDG